MWPWSKKQLSADNNAQTVDTRTLASSSTKPVVEHRKIPSEKIRDAITTLRGDGAHFYLRYAQMNGYEEKLNNPERTVELIIAANAGPNFTEKGIEFAIECEMEELTTYAKKPEGVIFPNLPFEVDSIKRLKQEQEEKRWARELLAEILKIGNGDLGSGFSSVGFDFKSFLIETAVMMRENDLNLIFGEVERRKDALKPLFLRAYSRGRNKYGEIELDPLYDEVHDFFKAFFPNGSLKFFFLGPPLSIVVDLALTWVEGALSDEAKPIDGIDFEHWCARKIEEQGWLVTVSKASGDQGVDVVASKDSISVVVQCKRYSTPIGNKAVQEAFSGARHYNADLAVVIGTGGFTKSAQELALSTNVILLDAEMIGDFSEQVFNSL